MPEITVSDQLYRQIQAEASDENVDQALWKMVGRYRRRNNPEADTT
jgi:hypothetical protein